MLIAWMAYATLIASCAYFAALAVERAASVWNAGQRFVWIAALLVSAVTPAVLATRVVHHPAPLATPTTGPAAASSGEMSIVFPRSAPVSRWTRLTARSTQIIPALDPFARDIWIVASLAWLVLLCRAAIVVRRQRARWRAVTLDGTGVLVASNLGPAVVGALRPRVIIPEWALALDAESRALMLRHESEHIRARDPLLLFGAALVVAVFPWNPALWLLVRRLRLAIEIDCDQRVLSRSTRQREYGMLLLAVGARNSFSLPFATSLAERRPFLERRIRAMTTSRPRSPRLVTSACIALAALVTGAATRAPRPQPLMAQTPPVPARPAVAPSSANQTTPATSATPAIAAVAVSAVTSTSAAAAAEADRKLLRAQLERRYAETNATLTAAQTTRAGEPGLTFEEIRALIALHYPSVLQGDSSFNLITIIVDKNKNFVLGTTTFRSTDADSARSRDLALTKMMADSAGRSARVTINGFVGDSMILAAKVMADRADKASAERAATAASAVRVRTNYDPIFPLSKVVDPQDIDNVQVLKLPAGRIGPLPIGVIVIQLKTSSEK